MYNQFIQEPEWSEIQMDVLNSPANLIVSGCAGSGKSLLACHMAMRQAKDKKVALLVFTKALRTFIKDYIAHFDVKNINVHYEYEWREQSHIKHDIIIVDEFQDFSKEDINAVLQRSQMGVYLFGDPHQRLYKTNLNGESTVGLEELKKITGFKIIELTQSFRISNEIRIFINAVYKSAKLKESLYMNNYLPIVKRFETVEDEIEWIASFLKANQEYKNIGILLKQNNGFKGAYFEQTKLRKDQVYGILDLKDIFKSKGLSVAYKYESDDHLDFSKDSNINILTYHSAKGLQFDCVLLPFSNYVNDSINSEDLTYVGLTRSIGQVIITYSGLICEDYNSQIERKLYNGIIKNKLINDPIERQMIYKLLFEKALRQIRDSKDINVRDLNVYGIDTSDCEVVKF